MHVDDDFICKVCKKVFCCANCRHKHAVKNHAIIVRQPVVPDKPIANDDTDAVIYLFCPICEAKPLPLQQHMYTEMLEHIESQHLPLHCRKCDKVYSKITDLKQFSKCLYATFTCQDSGTSSVTTNQTCDTDTSKETVAPKAVTQNTISTQTSPMLLHDSHITPVSLMNLRWKTKCSKITHEEFIGDSISSIKNLSSISNSSLRRSAVVLETKGKLVRSTSTPVHAELVFAKPKEQIFNDASNGPHVSSIYNCVSETESPAAINANLSGTPSKQTVDNMQRYLKVAGRPKMSAVTPLRQVMSKSIQKAFAEHGLPTATVGRTKKIFDASDTSPLANGAIPLDLRLSPALRRTQSEICQSSSNDMRHPLTKCSTQFRREILLSSQKLTTESVVITSTKHLASFESSTSSGSNSSGENCISFSSAHSNTTPCATAQSLLGIGNAASSMYKSCHSVEIITTATELSAVAVQKDTISTEDESIDQLRPLHVVMPSMNDNAHLAAITPITSVPGSVINKKIINFETPKVKTETERQRKAKNCSPADVFFTPNSTPVQQAFSDDVKEERTKIMPRNLSGSFSMLKRPSIRECAQMPAYSGIENLNDADDDDDAEEVFLANAEEQARKEQKSIVVENTTHGAARIWSLMRKMGDAIENVNTNSNSLIKRCASIAGSLVRTRSSGDEAKSLKRKRTYTIDNSSINCVSKTFYYSDYTTPNTNVPKRFRIHGRQPIERMRKCS